MTKMEIMDSYDIKKKIETMQKEILDNIDLKGTQEEITKSIRDNKEKIRLFVIQDWVTKDSLYKYFIELEKNVHLIAYYDANKLTISKLIEELGGKDDL